VWVAASRPCDRLIPIQGFTLTGYKIQILELINSEWAQDKRPNPLRYNNNNNKKKKKKEIKFRIL
jgi:hypothetical protein